jgi:hypothetical protein
MGSDLVLVTGASGYVALILVFWRAETKKMGLGRRWRLGSMIASHRSEIASGCIGGLLPTSAPAVTDQWLEGSRLIVTDRPDLDNFPFANNPPTILDQTVGIVPPSMM